MRDGLANDTQLEFARGTIVEVEAESPSWAVTRLDDDRLVTGHCARLAGRRDLVLQPGDRVIVNVLKGYCLFDSPPGANTPAPSAIG